MLSRYLGRVAGSRIWRNSWSGYAIRLWPIWIFGVPSLLIVLGDPSTMAVTARIAWCSIAIVGMVWVGIDHIAMCGEYIWFRGWWVPRRFHVSEIVNAGLGGGGSSPITIYVIFRDRNRKDNSKTIRMDLSRYMWIDRRKRLMDDIAAWLVEHGQEVIWDSAATE